MKGFYSVLAVALLMGSLWLSTLPKDADGVDLPASTEPIARNISGGEPLPDDIQGTEREMLEQWREEGRAEWNDFLASYPEWVKAKYKCPSPDCTCEPCECDPCECKASTKSTNAENVSKPIIYFFTRSDCIYCPPMRKVADKLHQEGHTCYVVDESRQDLVSKYGVTNYPTFLVVDGDKQVRRVVGLTTKDAVLGTEPTLQSAPVTQTRRVQVYKPQRTGWFRARSACGPGGCR